MGNRIILCSNCGSKNRIPEEKPNGVAISGNCTKQLIFSGNGSFSFSSCLAGIFKLWFIWLLGFIFIAALLDDNSGSYNAPYSDPSPVKAPTFSQPQVPISHGIISKNFSTGVAPLEIKTSYGRNYFVKVINVYTHEPALTAYIVGGQKFEVEIPLGTYEIRYAAGDIWYGPQYNFGPETSYSKADELFNFTADAYGYTGYTVELIMQVNGNLRTIGIDQSSF